MNDYHDCGLQLQVEYRHDGQAFVRVYYYDDKEVTVCPNCGAPLPTELMQPDPDDDPFLSDVTDFDILQSPTPAEIPDEDNLCTPASF